jgi:hypothetical protein
MPVAPSGAGVEAWERDGWFGRAYRHSEAKSSVLVRGSSEPWARAVTSPLGSIPGR